MRCTIGLGDLRPVDDNNNIYSIRRHQDVIIELDDDEYAKSASKLIFIVK